LGAASPNERSGYTYYQLFSLSMFDFIEHTVFQFCPLMCWLRKRYNCKVHFYKIKGILISF
jgi:hypothetical protein